MGLTCCAPRWRNGQAIDSMRDSTLLAAIGRSWIQLFGAIEAFFVDGEGRVTSAFFVEEMKRGGVQVDIRAPRQHACVIKRRRAYYDSHFTPQRSS
eukprot:9407287-Pyramimonas_sp.AAC.1